jgi:hypothetical protein
VAAARRFPATRLRALGVLCLLVALGGWAYASPVGASPDEDYHLASIWCGQGFAEGVCEPGAAAGSRRVPAEFPDEMVCYRWEPTQSAACQVAPTGELVDTDRGNFAGMYPPVFYWVFGTFTADAISVSVLAMRLINVLLFVALLVAVYLLVPVGLRRAMLGGALVTAVPLGVFLIPSINPSAWAILSATTYLVSLLGYLTVDDRRRMIALGSIAGLSLLLGAGARADSAAYAVVATGAALVLVWRRGGLSWPRLVLPGVLAIVAVGFYFSTGQTVAVDPDATTKPHSLNRLLHTILDIPALWIGATGAPAPQHDFERGYPWGLGWLDTALPSVVWLGGWTVLALVLFVALAGATRRRLLAVGLVAAAALAVPAYAQYLIAVPVGGIIQPRYVLPLLTVLAIVAMVRLDGTAFRLTPVQRWTVVGVLSLTHAVTLHTNLRRYLTGTDVTAWNLDRDIEWWWSVPFSPMVLWLVTSAAFAGALVLLTAELVAPADAPGAAGPAGARCPSRAAVATAGTRKSPPDR